ncbi:hypothetical protein C8A00DRAFT_14252 [Chaetomidium leptoderma]|uniref:RNB domain-containing protein n=1 Tax=Chaetomidium leptoderma TaxID=669021 RepID=A0AAN6VN34_9PEZI|nr:hypothetical protein C8A00DRAFT_14252 [Chaetomidium leptoderma]
MMRRSSQNYVCWRCLSPRPAERARLPRRTFPAASAAFSALATASGTRSRSPLLCRALARRDRPQLRSVSTQSSESPASGTASDSATDPAFDESYPEKRQASIRDRLRIWETENPAPSHSVPSDEPADGGVGNTLIKSRGEYGFKVDVATQDDDATHPHFDGVDVADLGQSGAVLQAGDLVEVSSSSWGLRLLAVCLGNFNGHLHFYTSTGKWFTSRTVRSGFVVKNFVDDPAELQAVVEAIPSLSPSTAVLNRLQDLNVGPSRDLAASLIRKIYTFQSASRHIHQTYVERLGHAHAQLGNEEKMLNLREIADALLPTSLKRNKGAFPPEALYAVYSVIEADDVAFRALDRGARHHESYIFALHSAEVRENVVQVEQMVRDHYELASGQTKSSRRNPPSAPAAVDGFLEQARDLIDQVRKEREWSPHGMIGPFKKAGAESSKLEIPAWSETSLAIIKFMQHWAASDGFRSGSRCHWIGASILRLVRRYDEALLDSTTGWTFLQEIGWIQPWDVSSRHALRLPEQQLNRHPGILPPPEAPAAAVAAELGPDQLADLRQDFARSTVYCIDSADTLDVDDGVSLEPVGNGEYWVHIHVADPASRITPENQLATNAALRAQTNYLAGYYQRMLDRDDVRDTFSLGPNQPTLTFSARVDETGRLLDSKVTPGILRDVVYLTPEDVSAVVGDAASSDVPPAVLEVGTRPAKNTPPVRKMTTPNGLSRAQRSELETLSKLANALHRARLDNGAIPAYLPRPKATVSVEGVAPGATSDGSAFYRGDPHIRVAYEGQGSALVSSLMQLAGEVGARWCYERDIPIPYRVQLYAGKNSNALRAFNRDVLYPQLVAGKKPSSEDWHTLRALVGGFDVSTTPGSNLAMGLDLYTKVTSPLRRYPDLIVHWQIEAALREEHRRGQSLAVRKFPRAGTNNTESSPPPPPPAKREVAKGTTLSFLPFSKKKLDNSVLPRLRVRERHSRLLDNVEGNSQWILQALVRAWRFGEEGGSSASSQLPKTFRFTVSDVVGRRFVKGQLDWFDRPAHVELEDMNGVARIGEVKTGDVFEAELANVNVHTNRIYMKLLKRVEGGQ